VADPMYSSGWIHQVDSYKMQDDTHMQALYCTVLPGVH
jgi:hypothetical protein